MTKRTLAAIAVVGVMVVPAMAQYVRRTPSLLPRQEPPPCLLC
jgi:hypothetical protein